MSTRTAAVLPDMVPFDPIAYATGAEGFDRGVTWEQLRAMDAMLSEQEEPPGAMMAWRRSYVEGYLAAQSFSRRTQHVAAMRLKAVR